MKIDSYNSGRAAAFDLIYQEANIHKDTSKYLLSAVMQQENPHANTTMWERIKEHNAIADSLHRLASQICALEQDTQINN